MAFLRKTLKMYRREKPKIKYLFIENLIIIIIDAFLNLSNELTIKILLINYKSLKSKQL